MQTDTERKIYYNKNRVMVRESQLSDIMIMGDNLRETDKNEIWASHHHTPEEALLLSFNSSIFCFTVENKGVPVALFGISPFTLLDNKASIWLLATDSFDALIKKNRKEFIRQSKIFIGLMLEQYPLLENYVDARNIPSVKWLQMCRAKIEGAKPYGIEKMPFHYFSFRRAN